MTDDSTPRIADRYSRDAEAFGRHWAPYLRSLSLRLLAELPLADACLVLDLGTGTGGLLQELRAAALRAALVGCDLAEGMLDVAQRLGVARLAAMDLHHVGLRDGVADVALMTFVLHRLSDPAVALAEAYRLLRPGGTFGSVTWGAGQRSQADALWLQVMDRHGVPSDPPTLSNHDLVDTPEKVQRIAESVGLTMVEAWVERRKEQRTVDGWIDFASGSGLGRRLGSLPAALRLECLDEARVALASLPTSELVTRSECVYLVARR